MSKKRDWHNNLTIPPSGGTGEYKKVIETSEQNKTIFGNDSYEKIVDKEFLTMPNGEEFPSTQSTKEEEIASEVSEGAENVLNHPDPEETVNMYLWEEDSSEGESSEKKDSSGNETVNMSLGFPPDTKIGDLNKERKEKSEATIMINSNNPAAKAYFDAIKKIGKDQENHNNSDESSE